MYLNRKWQSLSTRPTTGYVTDELSKRFDKLKNEKTNCQNVLIFVKNCQNVLTIDLKYQTYYTVRDKQIVKNILTINKRIVKTF